MKGKFPSILMLGLIFLLLSARGATAQDAPPRLPDAPLGTAFTYQGRLSTDDSPADGAYDLRFILYDAAAGGSQVGSTLTREDLEVNQGYFTVTLDFGASAFNGQARWLEISVRPGSSSAAYAVLSPRQALTAAPYAAYSLKAPWSGLSGVPAGFADGVDNDTTYSAGDGLSLTGTEFALSFAGDGAADSAARSDHNHLGETWSGVDNPLVITGTFGAPDFAPLTLSNGNEMGVGLRIQSTALDGVYVDSAGADGLRVWSAGGNGVSVLFPGHDGVNVFQAGSPFSTVASDENNGFEVAGAEGHGLYVGHADGDGVFVDSASTGFSIASATRGVLVQSATVGMRVDSATVGLDIGSATMGLTIEATNTGVQAEAWTGVSAESTSASGYGGEFFNSASGGVGLYARGGSNSAPDLVLGGNDVTNDDGRIYSDPGYAGSDLLLISNDAIQLELDNDNDEPGNVWVVNGTGTTVFAINESGDTTAIGTKTAAVNTQDYGMRKLYAMESPENWFEDFGSAALVDGAATVLIDPIFAQTVNLSEAYHVFLTPLGDCALYVEGKTAVGFTVRAMGGQACSIPFDYRIVAKRLGYEDMRLEPAAELERAGEQ